MIHSDKIADVTLRPDQRGRCHTGMEILAAVGAAATVVSTGMSIAGASQQADAQRQAGEVAYQNALRRNETAQAEAKRMEDKANSEQAIAQRDAIEKNRRARLAAGRAQAVMAASGAGVDEGVLSGILSEGDFAFDTALAEGDQRAQDARYDARLRRWEGEAGVTEGMRARSAMNRRAGNTETMGIVGGAARLGSLAAKYGGSLPGTGDGGIDKEIADWSKYGTPGGREALNRLTDLGSEFDL